MKIDFKKDNPAMVGYELWVFFCDKETDCFFFEAQIDTLATDQESLNKLTNKAENLTTKDFMDLYGDKLKKFNVSQVKILIKLEKVFQVAGDEFSGEVIYDRELVLEDVPTCNINDFYIGSTTGSGLSYNNIDDFLEGLRQEILDRSDRGETSFTITIED